MELCDLSHLPCMFGWQAEKVHELNEEIGKLLAKAEQLGAEGNVDEAQTVLQEVEKVRTKKKDAEVRQHTILFICKILNVTITKCDVTLLIFYNLSNSSEFVVFSGCFSDMAINKNKLLLASSFALFYLQEEYRNSMPASSFQQQKLRVCEVCSAYLGLHDNDRRLADHFGGKLHLGFIQIREKLEQLKVTGRPESGAGGRLSLVLNSKWHCSIFFSTENCAGQTGETEPGATEEERRAGRERREWKNGENILNTLSCDLVHCFCLVCLFIVFILFFVF